MSELESLKNYPIGMLPDTERGRETMEFHAEILQRASRAKKTRESAAVTICGVCSGKIEFLDFGQCPRGCGQAELDSDLAGLQADALGG